MGADSEKYTSENVLEHAEQPATPEESVGESAPRSPGEKLSGMLESLGVNTAALTKVESSLGNELNAIFAQREKLGLPPTNEVPPSIVADTKREVELRARNAELSKEIARLNAEIASKNGPEVGGTWSRPVPSEKEVRPDDGQPYGGHTFYRFSPEQRAQIAKDAVVYEGVRYNVGDKVFVNGHEATVAQFYPGGAIVEQPDYGADASGRIHREETKPASLLLNSENGMFFVHAGETQVKRIGS